MPPGTPAPRDAARGDVEVEVGDLVNVPGDMHGTVRFVGSVKGKPGMFAGVELSQEFAQRGKNDGDADGCVAHGLTVMQTTVSSDGYSCSDGMLTSPVLLECNISPPRYHTQESSFPSVGH